jgi:hypothetical protein
MSEANHTRAVELIDRDRIEGISSAERSWLDQHLAECTACAERARVTESALRSLRALSIAVPRGLAARTQFRVRLRAQELRTQTPRWQLVWIAAAVSWVFGAATAPYVWQTLQWIGHRSGAPDFVWKMGFGLWWTLPAMVAAVVLLIENAGRQRDSTRPWNETR